ncbi:MAG: YybH family protein [Candidatus Acidiferrales bacterium]
MNRRWLAATFAFLFLPGIAAHAQKKSKVKTPPASESATPPIQMPAEQVIDREISEMLGYWQLGDVTSLHKYYSDTVTLVSGTYEPPITGWTNYAAAYERQRARVAGVRLDRRNTFIFVKGDVAWASYQWEFSGSVDGKQAADRGQTTLIFVRQGDRWYIVHNHTSEICEAQSAPQAAQPPAAATQP